MSYREADEMYLDEWSSLNQSFIDHPPADLLVAAYMKYKAPRRQGPINNLRDAASANSEALGSMIHPRIGSLRQMLVRGSTTMDKLPAWTQTPEKMAMIERMKREMGVSDGIK